MILFSSVAGEDWFIYIRLVLAIFCLVLSVLSILMTEGAASFARAVMLGHSNEIIKKKDTKGLGDGPAMFIICFVCMLIIGSVIFMVGYLVFEHTAAWAMAGGLVVAGACMGGAAKLLGGGQGVDIPISQATTMKMLAGDLLLSVMLFQSVLEGFTDENNETMVKYGM